MSELSTEKSEEEVNTPDEIIEIEEGEAQEESEAVVTDEETEGEEEAKVEEGDDKSESDDDVFSGDIELVIGGEDEEEPETNESSTFREMRKRTKELEKKLRALEAEKEAKAAKLEPLGDKPTLAGCDYDEDAFEAKLTQYHTLKQKHDNAAKEAEERVKQQTEVFQAKRQTYQKQVEDLGAKDFADSETQVVNTLSEEKQSAIVSLCKKPAAVVYALGKNQKLAEAMSKLDGAEFVYELGKLEARLKVTSRKPTTKPETKPVGSGGVASDTKLTKLREEAQRTGDFTTYLAAKRAK